MKPKLAAEIFACICASWSKMYFMILCRSAFAFTRLPTHAVVFHSPENVDLLGGDLFLLLEDLLRRAFDRLGRRHHILLQHLVVRRLVGCQSKL